MSCFQKVSVVVPQEIMVSLKYCIIALVSKVYSMYQLLQRFTLEEADKPDTYYQTPRQALEEEFDVRYNPLLRKTMILLVFSLGSKRVFTNWFMTL